MCGWAGWLAGKATGNVIPTLHPSTHLVVGQNPSSPSPNWMYLQGGHHLLPVICLVSLGRRPSSCFSSSDIRLPHQGLVAGFALLNFCMTYLLYSSTHMRKFLSYYAPLAQNNNRAYYALITLSVISSTSRYVGGVVMRPIGGGCRASDRRLKWLGGPE